MLSRSLTLWIMRTALCVCVACAAGCSASLSGPAEPPTWSFDSSMIFPADRSLSRPEDGIITPDGRLIVSDRVHGLRVVASDGSSKPFGNLPGAGYIASPPDRASAANGVSLEPGATHLLVADILGGGIYRVALKDGATERVYQHPYGVNTACRDSTGAIWFTQSTQNTAEEGEARMFAAADVLIADGALWRLPKRDGQEASRAELIQGQLCFPNGLLLDERSGMLYMAECGGNRVLKARLDVAAGRIDDLSTLVELPLPDNVEMDRGGRLWIALPVRNQVVVVDPKSRVVHSAFHAQSLAQIELSAEFVRRGETSTPRMDLFTPAMWEPLPGPITGIILDPQQKIVYITGLGDALIRLRR